MNKKAIENFLSSLDMKLSIADHFANLELDAALYDWDKKTVFAIMKGIIEIYEKSKKETIL